jgi:hypothetical protein
MHVTTVITSPNAREHVAGDSFRRLSSYEFKHGRWHKHANK